jgi:hypothetical protein
MPLHHMALKLQGGPKPVDAMHFAPYINQHVMT